MMAFWLHFQTQANQARNVPSAVSQQWQNSNYIISTALYGD